MIVPDYEIMHKCGDRSWTPQWWNLRAWIYKLFVPCPATPMISPYNPDQVNAASYDVLIGNQVLLAKPDAWEPIDIAGKIYRLYRSDFILTATGERFVMPPNIAALFALKSSRGREGYDHLEAGFIDPSWHDSVLTMELTSVHPAPLPIAEGMRIGQIIFIKCAGVPIKGYDKRGRYNKDNKVQKSRG